MAKGQMRSNREVKKPKQKKVPPKATSPFSIMKPTAPANPPRSKAKT